MLTFIGVFALTGTAVLAGTDQGANDRRGPSVSERQRPSRAIDPIGVPGRGASPAELAFGRSTLAGVSEDRRTTRC